MNIFSYSEQRKKAAREIDRLVVAETSLDQEGALDHALNAASTIYHLIQWAQREGKLCTTRNARSYIEATTNQGLKMLHDVVTCNKHVTVRAPAYADVTTPRLEDNINYITTESGENIITEDNAPLITEESNIKVYFGCQEASLVLREAIFEFV